MFLIYIKDVDIKLESETITKISVVSPIYEQDLIIVGVVGVL